MARYRAVIMGVLMAMVAGGCDRDAEPTTPVPTGACCAPEGRCTVTAQANCGGSWDQTGICDPNPCPQPDGACCALDGTCTVERWAACSGGSNWTAFGVCVPNPCVTPAADAKPDFHLQDVNPNSARSGQAVSPRDYLGKVSAWYFGHAT